MKVEFRESFEKDLKRIGDANAFRQIRKAIQRCELIESIDKIPSLKKLTGTKDFYRIRVGDFRLGIIIAGKSITFVRVLHRKEIYRYFP